MLVRYTALALLPRPCLCQHSCIACQHKLCIYVTVHSLLLNDVCIFSIGRPGMIFQIFCLQWMNSTMMKGISSLGLPFLFLMVFTLEVNVDVSIIVHACLCDLSA
uniref:Uncharacterized protein n=1 Tax=Opuntia streptacantha TaxID=393608 RepID=A0A7C9E809_OPUST